MTPYDHHKLEDILNTQGLRLALVYLNQRVAYRVTAVYRLDNGLMQLVEVVDKLDDLKASSLPVVPLADSFCQFAMRDSQFVTNNTANDKRLDGHAYQGVVASYVGLPLVKSGTLFGTLCHYDFVERAIDDEEFSYLQNIATLLPKYL
ncbi:MAG: GAF domain-containing protein [Polaromonas sp.]